MARSSIALARGFAPIPLLLMLLATCAALVGGAASAAADAPEEAHGNAAPRLQINGGGALHVTTATPTITGVGAPGGPHADGRISVVISGQQISGVYSNGELGSARTDRDDRQADDERRDPHARG